LHRSWELEFRRALDRSPVSEVSREGIIADLTVDFRLQASLQEIVTRHIRVLSLNFPADLRDQLDAGLVVLLNGPADVLAIIPGADTARWYSNATQAKRGLGSTFKTFTLACAVESKLANLDSIVLDTPLERGEIPSASDYSPKNFDRRYLGPLPLIDAFALSRNLSFIRLASLPMDSVRFQRMIISA
jgi:penicillin-binding protein 1A